MEAAAAANSNKRLKTSATLVNWANLLPELLPAIAQRIGVYEDFTAFRGVCKSWRSATEEAKFSPSPDQLPWLMLAEEIQDKRPEARFVEGHDYSRKEEEKEEDDEDNARDYSRKFFSLSKKGMIRRLELPEARFKHCTSSLGWLITTDKEGNTELLHLLTRTRIPLPPLKTFKYYDSEWDVPARLCMRRATLSASPSLTNDYVLMVILGHESRLAYWKPGDKIWNVIEDSSPQYKDLIYYRDQFVSVDNKGCVYVISSNMELHNALGTISYHQGDAFYRVYLVESAGKLLALTRHTEKEFIDGNDFRLCTTHFRVYEFDGCSRWEEINSLERRSVFLGHNTSFSCNADEATTDAIKANCIYFTEDSLYWYDNDPGSNDMGVYRLEDGLIEEHYQGDQWCSRYCPPLWVVPSF